MMKINKIIIFLLGFNFFVFGQINTFEYQRKISGKTQEWNVINLPEDIYNKTNYDLSDIRIYGITSKKDTIETPYIIRLLEDKVENKLVDFKIINTSSLNSTYFFTLEGSKNNLINEIKINFENQNFDWKLKLEGSNNQNEWFTLIENYRIVSISNSKTNYVFSNVNFSDSKYNYYRISIKTVEKPILKSASAFQNSIQKGKLRSFPIKSWKQIEHKKEKYSEIEVSLKSALMISQIQLTTKEKYDYYRTISIEYLSDSLKTEKGWLYSYSNLSEEILSSIGNNTFNFSNTTTKKIKIRIENDDNIPLNINSISVKGTIHELIFRSTHDATYFLVYGNKNATFPTYDIEHFINKSKNNIKELTVDEEVKIFKNQLETKEPLFKNQLWLWIIMLVVIVILGWFSLKMLSNTQQEKNNSN